MRVLLMKVGLIHIILAFVMLVSNAIAQEPSHFEVTLIQKAPFRIELNQKSDIIGYVEKGEKGIALSQSSLHYQIQTKSGAIGWVEYQYLKESKNLVIDHHEKKPVAFFKNLDLKRKIVTGVDKIRDLEIGEKVTYLEGFESKGFVKIKDKNGVIGYTYWQYARLEMESVVPDFEQLDYSYLLESQVVEFIDKPFQKLVEELGTPSAQLIQKNGDGILF